MCLKSTKTGILFILAGIFILMSNFAYSEGDLHPVRDIKSHLTGTIVDNTVVVSGEINWSYHNEDKNIDGFIIYYADSESKDKNEFSVLAKLSLDELINYGKGYYGYKINELKGGSNIWSFAVTAYNENDESDFGSIIFVRLKNDNQHHKLYFTSNPILDAKINTEYSYFPEVGSSIENPVLRYTLNEAPKDAQVDSETGEISWTPTESGNFNFVLKVMAVDGDKIMAVAVQQWFVYVNVCDHPATIVLKIVDENGEIIPHGMVEYFGTDPYHHKNSTIRRDIKFVDGIAKIENVDKGEYYILVAAFDNSNTSQYYGLWYENALNLDDAKALEVDCDDELEITFVMKKIHQPKMYKVSGTVIDAESLEPIRFALVEFDGKSVNFDKRLNIMFKTDNNGYYEGLLPEGFSYIASSGSFDAKNTKTMYFKQYYNLADNLTDAKIIDLTGDVSNIDFKLKTIPVYSNSISGKVILGDSVLQGIEVTAFLVNTDDSRTKYLYFGTTSKTDENGKYTIKNLIPGNYVILAHAYNRGFTQGFYLDGDSSSISWEEAARVSVTEESNNGNYDIVLFKMDKRNGKCIVKGRIGKHKKGLIKSGEEVQSIDVVIGASVYLLNSDNKVVQSFITDDLGGYELKNVPAGTYTLVLDKVGYSSHKSAITLGEETIIESDFEMSPLSPTSVEDNKLMYDITLYPNPSIDNININFGENTGPVEVTLYSNIGLEISNFKNVNTSGVFTLQTKELPSGIYFIKVKDRQKSTTKSVVIMK